MSNDELTRRGAPDCFNLLKFAKGRNLVEFFKLVRILRERFSVVKNLSGLCVCGVFLAHLEVHISMAGIQKIVDFCRIPRFPMCPPAWGLVLPAGVIIVGGKPW